MSELTEESILSYFKTHGEINSNIDKNQILKASSIILKKIKDQKNIFTMGNGGSAHNASHFITDWSKMANVHSGIKVRGICLNDNNGLITAYSNDISFSEIFSGQLKYLMNEGDLVIAVSGSGNSQNVVKAVEYANENGGTSIAFVGYDGGKLKDLAHHTIHVPSFDMQICEDAHLSIGHIIMKYLCSIDSKLIEK